MKLHLSFGKEEPTSVIAFLNTPAIDFYSGKLSFEDPNYAMNAKSFLLTAFNYVEGSIYGQFDRDMFLHGINNDTDKRLNEMFPTGCEVFRGQDLGALLCKLRDANAHARISDRDSEILQDKLVFKKLNSLKKMNLSVSYLTKDSMITMGGLIASVLLFLRARSVMMLCKRSKIFWYVGSKLSEKEPGELFVKDISHVNLELPIRRSQGDDLRSALFGEYEESLIKQKDGALSLLFGTFRNPSYSLKVNISNDGLIGVKKNSLTKVFYEKEYSLRVSDMRGFIEIANELPPFAIVDLLYKMGVSVFDEETYQSLSDNMSRYSKLNYPKFYVDKNVDVLLMPSTQSDFTVVSSLFVETIAELFLRFEEETYRTYGFKQEGYSSLKNALSMNGFSQGLIEDLIALRNFSMHGYVMNEFMFCFGRPYKFSFEFVIKSFRGMLLELKDRNSPLLGFVQKDINERFVKRILALKYNSVIDYSLDAFKGHPKYDPTLQSVKNKMLYLKSSTYETRDLNNLYVEYDPPAIITENIVEGEPEPFYLYANKKYYENALARFLGTKECIYSIDRVDSEGVIETVYWTKQQSESKAD